MQEINISSTLIKNVSYQHRTMFVKLNDERLLSYNSVPEELFEEFIATDSHDEFYKTRILTSFSAIRMS